MAALHLPRWDPTRKALHLPRWDPTRNPTNTMGIQETQAGLGLAAVRVCFWDKVQGLLAVLQKQLDQLRNLVSMQYHNALFISVKADLLNAHVSTLSDINLRSISGLNGTHKQNTIRVNYYYKNGMVHFAMDRKTPHPRGKSIGGFLPSLEAVKGSVASYLGTQDFTLVHAKAN